MTKVIRALALTICVWCLGMLVQCSVFAEKSFAQSIDSISPASSYVYIYNQGDTNLYPNSYPSYNSKRIYGSYTHDGVTYDNILGHGGCGLYTYAHAIQWLTSNYTNESSAISLLDTLIAINSAPYDTLTPYDNYIQTLGVTKVSRPTNEAAIVQHFSSGGVIILHPYNSSSGGHYCLAVGAAYGDLDGQGSKLWIHVLDSSVGSTTKRISSYSAYGFVSPHGKLDPGTCYFGANYWIPIEAYLYGFTRTSDMYAYLPSEIHSRTIPDGNYLICCEDNPQYYLDIYGAESPAQNMTVVGAAGPLSSVEEADTCDIWTIKYESDGYYSIKQFRTDMTLSVYSDLVVVPDYGTDTQRWSIVPDGANGYRIQAKFSGQYIDRSDGMYIRTKGDVSAQGWVFKVAYGYDRTIPDGNYLISCENNLPYYLDVTGDDLTAQDLTTVGITGPLTSMEDVYSCDIWTVKYESNGFYSIKQYQTDKALTVYPDMVVCQDYGTDTQRWAIIPDGANGYRFQVKAYGTYLDRNSSLYVRSEGSVSDQGWAFTPYPYGHVPTIPDGNYLICCEANQSYFLDVIGNAYPAEDSTRLCVGGPIIDGEVNDKCTAWTVKYESDGFYSIRQYNTSKALSQNTDMIVFEDYGTVGQRWTIDPDGANGYRIRVKYNRLYLDIESGGANWGSGIQLNSKRDVAAQGWVFIPYNPAPDFNDPDFILPSALTIIDESAFEGITATVVYVPDTCTNIGKWAFRNCIGLTQIRIPENCAIGTDAFAGCNYVVIFGAKGSPAETYANSHTNCAFAEE